jgi:hypothetical protein
LCPQALLHFIYTDALPNIETFQQQQQLTFFLHHQSKYVEPSKQACRTNPVSNLILLTQSPRLQALLHFIYTDALPDSETSSSSSSSSSSTIMAQHLLAAADRYGLDRLRLICEAKLCEGVSVDTVATTLALAEQHHAAQLKKVCLQYAAQNLNREWAFPFSCPLSCGRPF